jgi:uncharacterized RDD family membrane protein YckC
MIFGPLAATGVLPSRPTWKTNECILKNRKGKSLNSNQSNNSEQKPTQNALELDNTAPLFKRVVAAFVDLMLVSFCVTPFIYSLNLESIVENPFDVPPEVALKILACEVLVFFVLNGVLLFRQGQTVGKRLMNLAVVDMNNQKLVFSMLIVNRYLIQLAMLMIPMFNIVDVLVMFFRRDRRCIHDLFARTKVVDLSVKVESKSQDSNAFLA